MANDLCEDTLHDPVRIFYGGDKVRGQPSAYPLRRG
ncbi:hypothetical protein SAMN05421548_13315 [Paraburkholderia lycopersici]|uniref:Uncharacterized protein n=1 Tax=Paraburkholderia lycopersici TaxID=416944 RepID=A0A1G7A7R6_9BURK|nr:hypothetical protein SAMN05421548_13315 [Paraburkholderia lycopersici]